MPSRFRIFLSKRSDRNQIDPVMRVEPVDLLPDQYIRKIGDKYIFKGIIQQKLQQLYGHAPVLILLIKQVCSDLWTDCLS